MYYTPINPRTNTNEENAGFPAYALLPAAQKICNGSATEPAAETSGYHPCYKHPAKPELCNDTSIAVLFGESSLGACNPRFLNPIRGVDYLDSLDTVSHASATLFVDLHRTATFSRRIVLRNVNTSIYMKKANSYTKNFTMRLAPKRWSPIFQQESTSLGHWQYWLVANLVGPIKY